MSAGWHTTFWDALRSSWTCWVKCMSSPSQKWQAWCYETMLSWFKENLLCYDCHDASPCQLCASKTWMVTTTSLGRSQIAQRVFGRKHRQGVDESEIQFPSFSHQLSWGDLGCLFPFGATGSYWWCCLDLGIPCAVWLQPKGSKECECQTEGLKFEIKFGFPLDI